MGFGLRKLYHVWGWAFRKGGELASPTALNHADNASTSDPDFLSDSAGTPTANAMPPSVVRSRMLLFFVTIVLATFAVQMVLWDRVTPAASSDSLHIPHHRDTASSEETQHHIGHRPGPQSPDLAQVLRQNLIQDPDLRGVAPVANSNNQADNFADKKAWNGVEREFGAESGLKNRKVLLSDPETAPALAYAGTGLLNVPDFRFLMLQKGRCPTSTFPFAVVVHSAPENWERRMAIRQTWGQNQTFQGILDSYVQFGKPSVPSVTNLTLSTSTPNLERPSWHQTQIPFVFLVGTTANATLQTQLEEEFFQYGGDLVQGSFVDAYRNLTYKHVMGLLWTTQHCAQARFILKTDDDVFVNLPLVMHMYVTSVDSQPLLKNLLIDPTTPTSPGSKEETNWNSLWNFFAANPQDVPSSSTTASPSLEAPASLNDEYLILCDVVINGRVVRSYRSKWRASKKEFKDRKYPPYCNGWAILYSQKTVARLLQESRDVRTYFFVDDVFVTGLLAQQAQITPQQIAPSFFMSDKQMQRISKIHSQLKKNAGPEGAQTQQEVRFDKHSDMKKSKEKGKRKKKTKGQIGTEIDMENLDEAKWEEDPNHVLRIHEKLFGPPQLTNIQVRQLWDWYRFVSFISRMS